MSLPQLASPPHTVAEDSERATHLAEMLRAVAHPLRLRIIAMLCDGEEHVNALAARLEAPQAIVSQHLSILRLNRLVTSQRCEGKSFYRLLEPRLRNLVQCLEGCRIP